MNKLIPLLMVLMVSGSGWAAPAPSSASPVLHQDVQTTIDCIAELESARDPKCYATASRLEDFIYGTPLSEEARFAKIELQKEMIRKIWRLADSEGRKTGVSTISSAEVGPVMDRFLTYRELSNGDWEVETIGGAELTIEKRDKRQYSTVAYGLRAILAVQQERFTMQSEDFLPLDASATENLKDFLDLSSLAALQISDREARLADRYDIEAENFEKSWRQIVHEPVLPESDSKTVQKRNTPKSEDPYDITRQIIAQKISSFEAYNRISQAVFLRNIQVYFARHRWPIDPDRSDQLKSLFTETLIYFTHDLLLGAEKIAAGQNREVIQVEDVSLFAKVFIPHRLNNFEDAIFFPRLPKDQQIYLESYDMDAFRDSGLHWQYLGAVLDEPGFSGVLEPDPFALELLVENVAQFAVLVLRVAGNVAAEEGAERLATQHFEKALHIIQGKIDANAQQPTNEEESANIVSSEEDSARDTSEAFFTDVTAPLGLGFQHRSSDWLNRLIRSYAIRDASVAVLAIPPAFGGSGAASEDINGDGLPDLLLLSGSGNRLWLNDGSGGFTDITDGSGIAWTREDGFPGEPRQPIIADFDNDGLQDIFITYVDDPHRLYRNLGEARFEDVTDKAGLGGKGLVGGPAVAFDYDNDGLLDLYIGYFGQYIEGILPTLARHNDNGLPNRLLRNVGGMRFEDVTEGSGVAGSGWTQAVAHTDFDLDGWQDLIEGNDFGINAYYRNKGDGTFENVTAKLGTDKPSYTMGVGIADLNGDLLPDIYISNIVTMDKDQKYVNPSSETQMKFDARTLAQMRVVEANDLFVSQAATGKEPTYIQSTAVGRGRSSTGWAWGADFFDFDNDGDDDLYVANGMNEFAVYSTEHPYFRDSEGKERNVLFPESTQETNVFFLNQGGKLTNSSNESGADLLGNSRAVAYLDFDRDGDLDMVLNNYHEPAVAYRNNSERYGRHWLKIRLIGDPDQKTTRDAIGARLVVTTDTKDTVWREVHGGVGYLTTHPKEQHFGLGQSETADIAIYWPGGETLRFSGLEADRVYTINQKDGSLTALQ